MRTKKLILLCTAIVGCSAPHRAYWNTSNRDDDVVVTLNAFLNAFENLKWEEFCSFFADDACVFHPAADMPARFCGKAQVEDSCRRVFDQIRLSATNGAPFMRVETRHLRIQQLGGRVAVVSFELENEERFGRRTIVMRKDGEAWRIVHLHASNFMLGAGLRSGSHLDVTTVRSDLSLSGSHVP